MISTFEGDYHFLSNFYLCPIVYEGREFTSTEAAYQSAKTTNPKLKDTFAGMSPRRAKQFSKAIKRQGLQRSDWFDVNLQIMEQILWLKFVPGSALAQKLVATGDEELVEGNTWGDCFYGVCGGKGQNHLGKLLMKIRTELLLMESRE
jgi:ribA/ribD-fused uncharacterized protein